ncbi:MAG: 1-(5-phosphoribosyl)-5-[(5-phosphoribosylamino)methylideneamino]imidazole-4-carboxamide isomerase [Anaerolineae bacterium]|nr:1-(5-phosphoribosyl)-5-[(5-phosphoribosylamino)methylideneamino]imidazole-4-carboxamide isomerase [Anaerolineae bacterium]
MPNPASSDFIVFPAIDLRGGQVVRLKEGDPDRQTAYSTDPAGTAERWLSAGAQWLHVVNLDGAFDQPDQQNQAALAAILRTAQQFGAPVQFGGGLRTLDALARALEMGVQRVVLGTLAVDQPEVLAQSVQRWGAQRIAAGLDARGGQVAVRGWKEQTALPAVQLANQLARHGLEWLIFTDIARDGLQTGVNLPATLDLARQTGLKVVASGGVNLAADVHAIRQAGLAGVIIGRALYEGSLQLAEVLC